MGKIKSFLNKINGLSPAAKASFWFVVSNVMLKGISFITTPIFTRLLGPGDYGITSVFVSWEGVISVFATLSLAGGVYNVALSKYEDDVEGYTSSMISLTFIASLIVYSVCIGINIIMPQLFQLSTLYLLYMWIQTFTNAAITFWLVRKRYIYDYKKVIAYTFANAILSPAVAIVAILLFPTHAAFAKVIGAGVAGIVIGIWMAIYWLVKGKTLYKKEYWGHALRFNLPLIPHYLSSTLLNSSDKIMINSIVGSVEAGLYGISHSITGMVSIITQAINHSLIPYTMQSIKTKNYKGLKNTITICSSLVAVICIGIMLFAREGILIFATIEYIDAVWFIPPLTMSVLFLFIYGIVGNIMFYYEKTWQMSAITIICAAVNIVTNYFGIKYFGYLAAGYTTVLCSFLKMLLCYLVVRKYEKNIKQIVDIKAFLLMVSLYIGFMAYSMIFYNNIWLRIALIAVILLTLLILHKKIIEVFNNMKKKEAVAENYELEKANDENEMDSIASTSATAHKEENTGLEQN